MEDNNTINIIYVIIAGAGLLLTFITLLLPFNAKINREAERFESWLKTHEKEITELKRKSEAQEVENKILKENQNSQYHQSGQENRRLENMISDLSKSIGQIDVKLGFLIDGKLKSANHE